jgi:hypothetical protein
MSWRNLRSISSDPLSNFLSKLAQDQIMREAQNDSSVAENLEEDKFIGKHTHSICEIRDIGKPFANLIPVSRTFLMPLEPDRNRLRLWVEFNSGADTQYDYSLWDNVIENKGYMLPVPITSPTYDEGIVGGQLALMYNNIDGLPKGARAQFGSEVAYTKVKDNPNIRLSSYLDGTITGADGFTISMLVRPMQLYNDTDINGTEGWNRRLCMKIDDSVLTYAYEVRITPQGSLVVVFRRSGVDYEYAVSGLFPMTAGADYNPFDFNQFDYRTKDPVTGVIYDTPNTHTQNYWVRLDIIYVFADNSVIVRKDGVAQTVTSFPGAANWTNNPTTHTKDLMINGGIFAGNSADRPLGVGITEWADFRIYAGQLTLAESEHLYENKYTISDIDFGCPAIMSYTSQSTAAVTVPNPLLDPFGITKLFPTKNHGNEWYSFTWGNGINRVIQNPPTHEGLSDPYDSQLFVDNIGDPKITIPGDGTMKVECTAALTGSPRVVVLSNWKNVEVTLYQRCPTISISGLECEIRAKTNHYVVQEDDDQLFGGYIYYTDYTNQRVNLRREIAHAIGYSDRQGIVNQTLPANTWLGFKAILYNRNDGNIKMEYYMDTTGGVGGGNWIKVTEAVDNGTWTGSGGGTPIYKPQAKGSAIRTDINVNGGYVEYKWWSIREIDHPLAEVSVDTDVLE